MKLYTLLELEKVGDKHGKCSGLYSIVILFPSFGCRHRSHRLFLQSIEEDYLVAGGNKGAKQEVELGSYFY